MSFTTSFTRIRTRECLSQRLPPEFERERVFHNVCCRNVDGKATRARRPECRCDRGIARDLDHQRYELLLLDFRQRARRTARWDVCSADGRLERCHTGPRGRPMISQCDFKCFSRMQLGEVQGTPATTTDRWTAPRFHNVTPSVFPRCSSERSRALPLRQRTVGPSYDFTK